MTYQPISNVKTTLAIVITALLALAATIACAASPPIESPLPTVTAKPTAAPTQTPRPTDTSTPTPTPTPTPRPTRTPTLTPTPPPSSVLLEPMNYQSQTYNNCGPASIAILLGYYDHWITQHTVNEQVSPGPSPCDIADYMPQYQLKARAYRSPSPRDPIRHLLANQVPVIVGQLLSVGSDIGHYRVIKGYDDVAQEFISDDPLQSMGPDCHISYDTFARLSTTAVIPVYPPEMDPLVRSLMRDFRTYEIYYCPP